MGASTYEWLLVNHPGEWMYEQPTWVVTHRPEIIADGHPVKTFVGDVAELHPMLLGTSGRSVAVTWPHSSLRPDSSTRWW